MLNFLSRDQQTLSIIYDTFPFQKNQVKSPVHSPPTKLNLKPSTKANSNFYIVNSVATCFNNHGLQGHWRWTFQTSCLFYTAYIPSPLAQR